MRDITIVQEVTLVTEECCHCGVLFAFTQDFKQTKLDDRESDRGWFYCPNGHSQHYLGKSLKTQLAEAKRRQASAEEDVRVLAAERDVAKRELRNARRRAQAALCPVPGCNRQIVQMSRHLHAKHPDFVHPETPT